MVVNVIGYTYSQYDSQDRIFLIETTQEMKDLEEATGDDIGSEEVVKEAIKEYIIDLLSTDDDMFNLMAEAELGDLSDLTLQEKNDQHGEQLKEIIRKLDGEWNARLEDIK